MSIAENDEALAEQIAVQGFDGRIRSTREIFAFVKASSHGKSTRFTFSLVFDGDRRGLETTLLAASNSICVGRNRVDVGVDDLVPTLWERKIERPGIMARRMIRKPERVVPFDVAGAQQDAIGPFSWNQQLYAAGLLPYRGSTLYGVRSLWQRDVNTVEERYSLVHTTSRESAVAQVVDRLESERPEIERDSVLMEVDDSRAVNIASGHAVFLASRQSRLGLDEYLDAFAFTPIPA